MFIRHRIELVLILLALFSAGAYVLRKAAWADGPPPSSLLNNNNIQKVIVKWDKQKKEIVDEQQVQQFYQAVIAGSEPLPYPTRCLADEHPEGWSVTFIRSGQAPFQVQIGIDGCGTFYIPQVGSTYRSDELLPLVKKTFKISNKLSHDPNNRAICVNKRANKALHPTAYSLRFGRSSRRSGFRRRVSLVVVLPRATWNKLSDIMSAKIKIADAGNVMVPAYLTLLQKGFAVRWANLTDDPEQELWFAEDATREFVADGPVALLGLVSLHETRGDNWQASDEQIEDFLSNY